jgi:trehalose synthase
MELQDVFVAPVSLARFENFAAPSRWQELQEAAETAKRLLANRVVWNVNSTATGGGVAEMLQVLLAYASDIGVDMRWTVIQGDAEFFAITKRIHNLLHGSPGDGGSLGAAEHSHYDDVIAGNAAALASRVGRDDVVILHDPQTAGLVEAMRAKGAIVVWRCHVGADEADSRVLRAWDFLRPYLDGAAAYVFSRKPFVPGSIDAARVHIIPPSIDPFSPKNEELDDDVVRSILVHTGITRGDAVVEPAFARRDGTSGRVASACQVVRADGPADLDAPAIVQVSRWDRLKDMIGVLHGFAAHVADDRAILTLVGPDVSGVTDDPEGQAVLTECIVAWRDLPAARRARVHLVSVPMSDAEENAAIVNAIQRHAAVVVQKSLAEGFGLTVAEAMWKARPVVASAVGGIQDQIVDGEHGVLLADPRDLRAMGTAIDQLLGSPGEAARLGSRARQRVIDEFLGDRHLIQWVNLLQKLG